MHVFGGKKKLVRSKFVQLLLLNRVKARWSKNRAAQGFHYINSFSSNFFEPIQKRAPARSVQLEAVYLVALLYFLNQTKLTWNTIPSKTIMKRLFSQNLVTWLGYNTVTQLVKDIWPFNLHSNFWKSRSWEIKDYFKPF